MKSLRGLNWEISEKLKSGIKKNPEDTIVSALLENRGINTKKKKEEFINPEKPDEISLEKVGINLSEMKKAVKRIKKALKENEKTVIYGDYDADGVCATAILWECLYAAGLNTIPFIPERFSEGYGLNDAGVEKLKKDIPDLKLIITVDNGITAVDAIKKAFSLGVDVVISDHHQKGKSIPKAVATIHTTKLSGAGIAWFLAREIKNTFNKKSGWGHLDLAVIGTVADQVPLLSANRSLVKYGIDSLHETKRPGLKALFNEAGIKIENGGKIGVYEIGYVIAPRINAMGRLGHAIDSLRLLCTKDKVRAEKLSRLLAGTNRKRQEIVEEVIMHTRMSVKSQKWEGVIVVSDKSYHEGVIGLAASKIVEEFYRPAVVISEGKEISKASARSISGFNIIKAIKETDDLIKEGGGHPMAAGFTLKTENIEKFIEKLGEISARDLTDDILAKKIKIDLQIEFDMLSLNLAERILLFEPTGIGNPAPVFLTKDVNVINARLVGGQGKHLKLVLEKDGKLTEAIAFGFGDFFNEISRKPPLDVVYNLEKNVWNKEENVQLKIKDIRICK